jgi:hypothetical protein
MPFLRKYYTRLPGVIKAIKMKEKKGPAARLSAGFGGDDLPVRPLPGIAVSGLSFLHRMTMRSLTNRLRMTGWKRKPADGNNSRCGWAGSC